MKKLTFLILLIITSSVFVFAGWKTETGTDKDAIKNVISEGYVKGMFKDVNLDLLEKYWHKECDTVALRQGELKKDNMGKRIKWARETGKTPPKVPNVRHEIKLIDVTGYAAVTKVEIFFGEKHIYTDYFSLYKFDNGWKIVTKIWYSYPKE